MREAKGGAIEVGDIVLKVHHLQRLLQFTQKVRTWHHKIAETRALSGLRRGQTCSGTRQSGLVQLQALGRLLLAMGIEHSSDIGEYLSWGSFQHILPLSADFTSQKNLVQ